jgi:hypothetical protein
LKAHYKSERAARTRLSSLVDNKVLQHRDIVGTKKSIYFLGAAAFRLIPTLSALASDNDRKPPTDPVATWAHLRASLYAALTLDGFEVRRDARALQALRQHLLDQMTARITRAAAAHDPRALEQLPRLRTTLTRLAASTALQVPRQATCRCPGPTFNPSLDACARCGEVFHTAPHDPWTCGTCGRISPVPSAHTTVVTDGTPRPCVGIMRQRPLLSYAVATRGTDVWAVLVDDPYRSLDDQLGELPARLPHQPTLDLVVRSSDDGSVYDAAGGHFKHKGPRQRAIERAFTPHDNPAVFPFWETVNVVHYRPELQHRVITSRNSHEEAA